VALARVDPAAPTGLAVFERRLAGLVRVNYYRTGSAGSTLGPADVRAAFGPADAAASGGRADAAGSGGPANGFGLLHVTGITCALGPGPAAAVRTAVELARAVVVRDTVGAGDAFVAGYLSGFLDRLPVEDCLHRAVTVAGFAVATDGDWEGLPTRAELPLLDAPPGTAIR
jgi:sugar/nucleoside kinase (ribokinase family)